MNTNTTDDVLAFNTQISSVEHPQFNDNEQHISVLETAQSTSKSESNAHKNNRMLEINRYVLFETSSLSHLVSSS